MTAKFKVKRAEEEFKLQIKPKYEHLEKLNAINYRLCPSSIPKGTTYHLYLTMIRKDGREKDKIKFLELAEKALTQLYRMQGPVKTFSEVLRSIVEDKGIYEYEYGIFFMLYAQFQRKYEIEDDGEQLQTLKKMRELIGNNQTMLKNYKRGDRITKDPLPVYIRNSIAHHGTNRTNPFTAEELERAIQFLREEVNPRGQFSF